MEDSMDKKNVIKDVVLVIAHEGYQPIEYCKTREELEKAHISVVTVSDKAGTVVDCSGEVEPEKVVVTVKDLANDDLSKFSGVFLIGGGGALDCLDNEDVYHLMNKVKEAGLFYGAICISTRILYHARLIDNKKITGWDEDSKLAQECPNATVIGGPVVVDGKLITGRDPQAASEFAQAIINALK